MDTYIVQRDIKRDGRECYYLVPGNKSIRARCGNLIKNPELVAKYAYDFDGNGLPTNAQYVLKNVALEEGEVGAYEECTIKSFELEA